MIKNEKVLIVEDDLVNCICALEAFKDSEDCIVLTAFNKECIKKLEEFNPTVALLDIDIAEGSGLDFGKLLKQKGTPFVYVTRVGTNVQIQDENNTALAEFQKQKKDIEIWLSAYGTLNTERNK